MKKNYTKKILLFLTIFVGSSLSYGQVKRLNDPSIVAHNKRMVFESWGDFRPYPKYFLGIQTNFAYATVWGWLAPSRNRDYKDGADIRPLKPTGLEIQRFAELEFQRKEAEKIKLQVDTLYTRNVQDFAHWTSVTVEADPLWLLYYKRMLKPLKEFPDNPQNYIQWQIKEDKTYQNMLANGGIAHLEKELALLKDKYNNSRTLDMPRGKRFLMYHETLIGWRKFVNQLRAFDQKNNLFLDYKKLLTKSRTKLESDWRSNDLAIAQKMMIEYKNKF
ncbi:hypothetical protein Q73A0000_05330 [Kaistella flava (ex Peng et al. 2021)]|uniref:DUF5045 domain-containing protein n=1 Tax=Kaistella flava (ex Peng et al. 2021) TaxID=2038776 RepID=A0A7M2Y6W5_9FLAO|nr:hypothetical protein Q73A0000_05330 [Kaistella flava (ex Peng et al. 2021)]